MPILRSSGSCGSTPCAPHPWGTPWPVPSPSLRRSMSFLEEKTMQALIAVLACVVVLANLVGAVAAQPAKGEPVNIGVGYFPSWNGGWSGVVIKKKELWKKY